MYPAAICVQRHLEMEKTEEKGRSLMQASALCAPFYEKISGIFYFKFRWTQLWAWIAKPVQSEAEGFRPKRGSDDPLARNLDLPGFDPF